MFDRGQCQPHYRATTHACVCISTTATLSLSCTQPPGLHFRYSCSLTVLSFFAIANTTTDQALVPHIHNGQYLIDNRVDQIPFGQRITCRIEYRLLNSKLTMLTKKNISSDIT